MTHWQVSAVLTSEYGVSTISRLLKILGLFCKRDLWKRWYSAKETYNLKEPTNRSHPMRIWDTCRCVSFAEYSLFYRALLQKRPIPWALETHVVVSHMWMRLCRHSSYCTFKRQASIRVIYDSFASVCKASFTYGIQHIFHPQKKLRGSVSLNHGVLEGVVIQFHSKKIQMSFFLSFFLFFLFLSVTPYHLLIK